MKNNFDLDRFEFEDQPDQEHAQVVDWQAMIRPGLILFLILFGLIVSWGDLSGLLFQSGWAIVIAGLFLAALILAAAQAALIPLAGLLVSIFTAAHGIVETITDNHHARALQKLERRRQLVEIQMLEQAGPGMYSVARPNYVMKSALDSGLAKMADLQKTIVQTLAAQNLPGLPAQAQAHQLPELFPLEQNLAQPSINNLLLGLSHSGPIYAAMPDLVHIALAGITRWGKSMKLKVYLFQILQSPEPCQIFLIDLSGQTFGGFGLPYATTIREAAQVLNYVYAVMGQRKELFKRANAETLNQYNHQAGLSLPYITLMIDEAADLFEQKDLAEMLTHMIRASAKYGIFLVMASQLWDGLTISRKVSTQFQSREAFKLQDSTQTNVFMRGLKDRKETPAPHAISVKGRSILWLSGSGTYQEIQSPYLSPESVNNLAQKIAPNADMIAPDWTNGLPSNDVPEPFLEAFEPEQENLTGAALLKASVQQILDLHDDGYAAKEICKTLLGYSNQRYIDLVTQIIEENT